MTVYVFDVWQKVRAVIPEGSVIDLVHDEAENALSATIPQRMGVTPGEHLGFLCVDNRFRMFTATKVENKDSNGTAVITATDAIVKELKETIVEELQQLDVSVKTAITALLTGERWYVTGYDPGTLDKSRAYFTSAWDMFKTFETLYKVRIVPYYQYLDGEINLKVVEVEKDEAVFRGRILQSRVDASNVYVIKTNAPVTRLYGLGPAQGTGDLQTNLTMADAEWSIDAGDPADKPKGQNWVEDAAAVAKYGLHAATVSITGAETAEDLLQKTWEHLQTVKEPSCTVEANVTDLETIPGYEHQIIRLGDLVPVRLANASMEEARVIGLKRSYIKKQLTKVTIGAKTASIKTQVSALIVSATHTFERLTIYQNRFHEDEALIQMNAEFIQLNAEAIEANAEQIRLNAEQLLVKADSAELEATKVRISAVETEITGLLKVDELAAQIASLGELHVGGSVNVPGTVTADTLWVNGEATLEGGIITGDINAYNVDCTGLAINGSTVYKTSLTVVTGIDVVTNLEGRITAVQPVTTQFYYYT